MIRKAEVNVVKVDRAPTGENVLLPEASERPTSMLSETAMQNLEKFRRSSAEKSLHRETFRAEPPQPSPPTASVPKTPSPIIPQMLPELPDTARSPQRKILGAAISAAAVATIGSGIYLYVQGQALWEKSRAAKVAAAPKSGIETTTFKSPEVVPPPALAARVIQNEVSDQVRNQAMAPVRGPAAGNPMPQVISKAISNQQLSALIVKPVSESVELRSGPGQIYQKVGVASTTEHYIVTDWSNQWFKVQLPNAMGKTAKAGTHSAWIKTDAVQVVSSENSADARD